MFSLSVAHHPASSPRHSPKIPTSKTISPSGFLRFSEIPYRRGRFHAKAARTEGDTTQNPPVSDQKKNIRHQSVGSPANSFLSFLCPLLKLFGGGDPSQDRNEFLEVATSSLSSLARLPWGSRSLTGIPDSLGSTTNPPQLKLYEFEACPFCRRVRETMTELDLSVEVYPCPKGSVRHREMVRKLGSKEQFPFLVDLNTGVSLYESGDIVKYLFQQYGQGRNPSFGLLESFYGMGAYSTSSRQRDDSMGKIKIRSPIKDAGAFLI